MMNTKYVVITPVRDEADYIQKTINSMAQQSVLPKMWVIVDDGSTDQTPQIIKAAAVKHKWIRALYRANRGFRKAGGGVIEAFYDGFTNVESLPWEFIVKLDGDLSFGSDYFRKCFEYFETEPKLGIAGGKICRYEDGKLIVDSPNDPPFHVRGDTKIYRRACWKQIDRIVTAPGWDTIDEVKANMNAWTTRTFNDLILIQHKPTGSADGQWRNWFKNGVANYITGYHPLFMVAKCLKRLLHQPLEAFGLWTGFCSGYLRKNESEKDVAVALFIRKQQLKRIFMKPSIYG